MKEGSLIRTEALFAAILALLVASCTSVTSPAVARRQPATIRLEPYVSLLRVVDVTIGGAHRPCLLDTGGGLVYITPEVAKDIGCEPFGRLTGFRNDGERVDTPRCGATDLEIGGYHTRAEVAVYDLMALLQGLPKIGGIVALPAFESQIVTLDLGSDRIIVETPESAAERVRSMREISVRPAREAGGAALDLFVAVDAPRGPIWLLLDSGNIASVSLSPHAVAQLGIDLPPEGQHETTITISGYGPVQVNASVRDTIYDGMLDARFMRGVVITIDLRDMRAWMAPHDGAG